MTNTTFNKILIATAIVVGVFAIGLGVYQGRQTTPSHAEAPAKTQQ